MLSGAVTVGVVVLVPVLPLFVLELLPELLFELLLSVEPLFEDPPLSVDALSLNESVIVFPSDEYDTFGFTFDDISITIRTILPLCVPPLTLVTGEPEALTLLADAASVPSFESLKSI